MSRLCSSQWVTGWQNLGSFVIFQNDCEARVPEGSTKSWQGWSGQESCEADVKPLKGVRECWRSVDSWMDGVDSEMGQSALERTREQGRPCFHWEKKMENVDVEKMKEVRKCAHQLTARERLWRPMNVALHFGIGLLPDRKWGWQTRMWPRSARPGPPVPGQDLPEKAGAPGSAHPAYFCTLRLLTNGSRGSASVSQGTRGKWELGLGTLFWELSSKAQPCGSCAWHSTTALTGSLYDQPCSHRCPERPCKKRRALWFPWRQQILHAYFLKENQQSFQLGN